MNSTANFPLLSAKSGQKIMVLSIGGTPQMRSKLAALGILPNTELRVINRIGNGALMVMVRGSRLALGVGLGHFVIVKETA